ncbi:hypothetical protein R3P38DRAFT_1193195 [Favolaschia claudopus]|uniref:Nephrocystin 3-like N-terminal domain-containing protein n=1 Tax=Favolaschia claudopus TaxID=2862362 RepID=A0AAW0E2T7_9AGAR
MTFRPQRDCRKRARETAVTDQSEQGQAKRCRSLPAVPQHISNASNHDAPGQHDPLSAIVPHFRQHSSPLSTRLVGEPNVYSINIYGGTGGSGGQSGNGQGGEGGFGQGGVFNNNNYSMSTSELQIEAAMQILHEAASNQASHDSGESYGRPPCHRDTRKEYLDRLDAWACATEGLKPLWMHGPAGTGKSSIAQSFCEQLHARGCLGGGFFFKRGHPSRGNAQTLFPTLAYQLATVCPQFKAVLAPRVAKNPALVAKSLPIQLQTLILEPYRDAASNHHFMMVIDGLDECDGENLQQQIIRCAMDAHSSGLRFLVVSRPESHIQAVVSPTSFDELAIEGTFSDIQRYLVDKFEHIRTTHEAMVEVIRPWPDYNLINTLIEKSSGHFIYAATVIKFIGDRDWDPLERLNIVMGCGETDPDSNSPFAALDQLYIQILQAVPSQSRLRRILAIASAKNKMWRLDRFSVDNIAQILQTTPANIHLTLRRLRSVIWLPETDSEKELFIWHHASFADFLNDPERAGEFYFDHIARRNLVVSVIAAFCDSQGSPPSFEPTEPHVTLNINLNFITTTRLSSDMAKSLDRVNLELIFGWDVTRHWVELREVLNWLKLHDAPRKLIQHWENIVYMDEFDFHAGQYTLTNSPHEMQSDELHDTNDISPQLLDIIQAYILFGFGGGASYYLQHIRWVLNISWQEMLSSIATARRYAGHDVTQDTVKLIVNAVKLYRVRDSHRDATLEVLATERFLLILAKSPLVLQFSRSWSCILRSCPHTENLLDALRQVVMNKNFPCHREFRHHIYHIRAWLRSHPSPHLAILEKLSAVKIDTAREDEYEADWIRWRRRNGFLQPI